MSGLIGYIFSILIGVSLGLIGGGGSILTLPVLVYILGINPNLSTAYSLFIVGATSLVGSLSYMKKDLVSYKTALIFAIPSFITVYLTRKYLMPAIPDHLFTFAGFELSKNSAIMLFFGVIMLLAAYSMITDKNPEDQPETKLKFNIPMIALEGIVVGTLTGIVGAGGGFLIIPALVLMVKLPMKMAVGTSLLIIAAKSLLGFLGDISTQAIDWPFLLIFTSFSVVGIFIGSFLTKYITEEKLKKSFGWFVLAMSVYIFFKEITLK